ncbi:MAG: pyruvate dehydrogenase (acetyl-transferring) E1 component subunit alpha [Rhodothermales bacterium]|nr:pyruvate dehydrogenase (acetyl-transferring) E1 component subunit alpha [Rhodothermales bacterium]MBO6780149.1 pyruvate dehydrogenase (acetyl-transferring) E1 component subunit alpha [Rhodothermales bacterium]
MAETKKTTTRRRSTAKKATNGQAAASQENFPDKAISLKSTFNAYPAGKYTHEDVGLSADDVLAMYRNMLLQRRFEERAAQMYGKQKIAGFLHLYIGQEAVSTGTATAIEIGKDSVITAYRDHGHGLALGMSANECMAELFGKIDGCSRGKGGSMHYFSKEKGLFGGHGIVGAHVPLAVGIGFGHKYRETGGVSIGFYGDGAHGQGAVHEATNLAGLYDLPVILAVENNQYAMGTAVHRAFSETEFTRWAVGYGLPSSLVNGMDVFAVTKAMQDHVAMARDFKPSFLEIRTYRYRGHSMSDPQKYRTKEELEDKKNEDPIIRLKAYLIEKKMSDADALDAIDEDVKEEVLASVEFSENSPFPDLSTIYEDIYEEDDYPYIGR